MENWVWAFWIENQNKIGAVSLDLGWFEDVATHLGLTEESQLNIWVLPYDVQEKLQKQDILEIWLNEIFEMLWIKSYVLSKYKFGNNKNEYEDRASFRWHLNIYGDLNINEKFSWWCRNDEVVYFFNEKDPRSNVNKILGYFRKSVSEIILINK